MRDASKEFRDHVENDGYVYQVGKITFANGITRNLLASDFYVSGNEWSEGAGTSTFPVGETIAKAVTICLVNDDDRFSTYDFYNAVIEIYAAAIIDGVEHRCMIGTYTVHEPESYGAQVTVHAIDDMHKADVLYTTNMTYPATVGDILADSCRTLGVTLATPEFTNSDYVITDKPAEMTHRQLWGLIAMLAAGCARMDERNHLHIISYDLSFFSRDSLDGGIFDAQSPYATGDNADGGNFTDYSSGDSYDGGTFKEMSEYHRFSKADTPTIATDDVVITGVRVTVGEERFLYGSEGYVLTLDNQLLSGDPADGVSRIGKLIIGMRFRPFLLAHTNYPFVEFGDICYVTDRKGNYYQSVVTDIAYIFLGKTSISCSADSPLRNSSTYNSEAAKHTAKLTQETFKAVEQINENIKEINGEIDEIDENIGQLHVSLKKTDEGLSAEVSRALGAEGSLSSRITLSDGEIAAEVARASAAEGNLSSRISITENNINLKVDKNGIIGAINLSSESASISASKINLEGYVTVSSLGSGGSTSIDGSRITTGTINADRISVNKIKNVYHNATILTAGESYIDPVASYIWTFQQAPIINSISHGATDDLFVRIRSDGQLVQTSTASTSARKWKTDISPVVNFDLRPRNILDIPVVQFKYKIGAPAEDEHIMAQDTVIGLIADDVAKYYPVAAQHDSTGAIKNWDERYIIPPMLYLLQEQEKTIKKMHMDMIMLQGQLNILQSGGKNYVS